MARRVIKQPEVPEHRCSECVHAFDFSNRAHDGHWVLCRCPYYTDGRFAKFMSDPACKEHFEMKKDN